jgi:hypothetical protein
MVIAGVWLLASVATVALRIWDIRTGAFRPLRAAANQPRTSFPEI